MTLGNEGVTPFLIIDGHADIPNPLVVTTPGTIDSGTAIDVDLLRAGGVAGVLLAANVVPGEGGAGPASDLAIIDAKIRAIKQMCDVKAHQVALALSADELIRIASEGKTAIMIELLGMHALGSDVKAIERYYRDGVRVLGFAHVGNNAFADSSRPLSSQRPNELGGLSSLGREAVERANDLGLLLDVSHLSSAALFQVLQTSRVPVIASHSGIRTLVEHPRNLSDSELSAIAQAGGVVGIVAFGPYLRNLTPYESKAREAITQAYGGLKEGYAGLSQEQRKAYYEEIIAVTRPASLDDLVRAVDYAVGLIGIDHVSLASDFNQGGGIEGWTRADQAPHVSEALRRHGYSDMDIAKLWGANIVRVLRAAQAGRR
ncbi:dipeptidase [Pseudomonas helleri]|uniref:dipeptidase n=1 Tax=Pseudomonas helleri TaxID=1608996 RepID=UPI003824BEDA